MSCAKPPLGTVNATLKWPTDLRKRCDRPCDILSSSRRRVRLCQELTIQTYDRCRFITFHIASSSSDCLRTFQFLRLRITADDQGIGMNERFGGPSSCRIGPITHAWISARQASTYWLRHLFSRCKSVRHRVDGYAVNYRSCRTRMTITAVFCPVLWSQLWTVGLTSIA